MNKDAVKQLGNRMLHYFRSECKGADGKEVLPSFVRFAAIEETSMHQLRELREKNAGFAKIAEECEEILCDRIVEGALHKRLDGSFAKFLLSEKYGYTEGKEKEEGFGVRISLSEPP